MTNLTNDAMVPFKNNMASVKIAAHRLAGSIKQALSIPHSDANHLIQVLENFDATSLEHFESSLSLVDKSFKALLLNRTEEQPLGCPLELTETPKVINDVGDLMHSIGVFFEDSSKMSILKHEDDL